MRRASPVPARRDGRSGEITRRTGYHPHVRRKLLLLAGAVLASAGCHKAAPPQKVVYLSWSVVPPALFVAQQGAKPERLLQARCWPAASAVWSPDGARIAATIEIAPGQWGIALVDAATHAQTTLAKAAKAEAWSPDGSWILATSIVDTEKIITTGAKRKNLQQLLRVPVDGSAPVKLSDGKGFDYSPALSPDGTRVVFVSQRVDTIELTAADAADGKNAKVLAKTKESFDSPSWSADGARVAYSCDRGGARRVCVVNADGSGAHELPSAGWSDEPEFSPDGKWLAFTDGPDKEHPKLVIAGPDGANPRPVQGGDGSTNQEAWSSDGKQIAFISTSGSEPDLWIADAGGGKPVALTHDKTLDSHPSWQPAPRATAAP